MKPAEEWATKVFGPHYILGARMHEKLVTAIEQARREGAEDMRERAADFFKDLTCDTGTNFKTSIAQLIRALPLEEETTRKNADA